jgi:hypothetical protein
VCVNQIGINYSVTDDPTVDYLWTVPANAMIVSGQTTNQVEVKWTTAQSGQVCVQAVKNGCYSAKSCVTASPLEVPAKPVEIDVD